MSNADRRGAADQRAAFADTVAAFADGEGGPTNVAAFPTGDARYRVGEVLGRGGMGTVFVAKDEQFGRDVALKEMGSEAGTTESIRRFLLEAVVTGNLEHPGIPAVYERGIRDGRPFYAMRKIEGRTLASAVKRARDAEERLALLPAVVRVAHTLGFAHEHGVVHRDVKPDNVVLGDHGETVLLDWGIARVGFESLPPRSEEGSREIAPAATVAGQVMGTPAYMAPEQAAGRVDAIDERTDVFALGALLYEVIGGVAPYEAPTSAAAIARALDSERAPLKKLAPDAPPALLEIVERAMAAEPAERYPDAAAVADAIEAFLTGSVTHQPSRWIRALGASAGVGMLILAILLAVLIFATVSSFAEQGLVAYAYVVLTVVSCLLAVVEWWTRGRHHLGPLILVFAANTVLAGIAGTLSGFGMVVRAVSQQPAPEQQAMLLEGLWEISGTMPASATLAAIQLLLWAIARRRALLTAEERATASAQRARPSTP